MGYIFESEIVTIMNTVRARTIGAEDAISLKEVLASDIHAAIKAYFKAEVERLLQQERAQELRSKRFPYGLPEVTGLQRQIDLLLVNHYEFDQQEFESLLDAAVHFEFNFLCRPQWTLLEFMFEGRRSVGVSEAIRKFKYCVEYNYFAEIFRKYVIDRGLAEMSYEEFRTLIEKIDLEIIERHSSRELARLLRPMVEFIEVGIPETPISEAGPELPINAAIVFFEDKKLFDIQKELERERDTQGRNDISLNDLARIVGVTRNDGAVEPEPDVAADAPGPETSADSPQPEPVPAGESSVPSAEAAEQPAVKPPPERPAKEASKRQRSKKKDLPSLIDVYSLFDVKEQKLFVRRLFQKDEVAFRNALDRLNPIGEWKDASFVLDEIFTANNVDPFSKEAIRLTEKLYERYAVLGQERT